MRVFQVGSVGSAVAYLALSYSHTSSGYPQAAAFLGAVFIATLTVGIILSIGTHAWPDDAGVVITGPRRLHVCHGCGHRMARIRSAWICGQCDRAG